MAETKTIAGVCIVCCILWSFIRNAQHAIRNTQYAIHSTNYMAKLTIQDVETIADLAKLTLTEEEKRMFQEQLSAVLGYAEIIQQLDTTDVPPMTSAIPLHNVMRVDERQISLSNEEALANAPQAGDGSFKVRAVLD